VFYGSEAYATSANKADNYLEVQLPYTLALGAACTLDKLEILIRGDYAFGGTYADKGKRTIEIGADLGLLVSASYKILDSIQVGLDAAYNRHEFDTIEATGKKENIGERENDIATSERNDFGFAPWVAKNLGGGVIKLGVAVMFPSSVRYNQIETGVAGDRGWRKAFSGEPVISVPISFTYSF
jgi:hypothetical protein